VLEPKAVDQIPSASFYPLAIAFQAKCEIDPAAALAIADQLTQQIIDTPPARVPLSLELELERIVSLQFAAEIQGTSIDTIEREDAERVARGEPSQIIQLSTRRKGVRIKHALKLA
jgi:hypothetical protein